MINEEFEKCIQQMKEKDRAGLQRVYEEYNSYIYTILLSYVGGHEDAEDLTVEFFIHLWNKAGSYRPGGGHKAWITRMARNLAVDFLRKNRREAQEQNEKSKKSCVHVSDFSLKSLQLPCKKARRNARRLWCISGPKRHWKKRSI